MASKKKTESGKGGKILTDEQKIELIKTGKIKTTKKTTKKNGK